MLLEKGGLIEPDDFPFSHPFVVVGIVVIFNIMDQPSSQNVIWKLLTFLDIIFDLQNNVYKPYRKTNDKPTYINRNSNHPPSILKQLTKSIEKRLSESSSTKDIFDKSLKLYQDALKDSGFSNDLHYVENNNNTNDNKWKKKGNIIWFNPPFSKSIKTNIGKVFLQILSKHFPKNHKLHKSFNRNTVKISYSCMKNIGSIISAHNWNILNPIIQSYGCNCRVKSRNHTKNFKHEKYKNCTELAKYIWQLKRSNINFSIKYSMASKVSGNPSLIIFLLCIIEKLWIIKFLNNKDFLNKKS